MLRISVLVLLSIFLLPLSVPLQAQSGEQSSSRFQEWNAASDAAREQIGTGIPANLPSRIAELEATRTQIAANRDRALIASRTQPFEAEIAEGKLALLGTPPETGESEFAAGKRQELEQQLYQLNAPQRAAEDSYLRSVSTIRVLDERIEDLKRRLLFKRGMSPLMPAAWSAFASEIGAKIDALSRGSADAKSLEIENRSAVLAVILLATLLGLGFSFWARKKAVAGIESRYDPGGAPAKSAALAISRDLAALFLLLLGFGILVLASGLLVGVFPTMIAVPYLVIGVGIPILLASWLGTVIFAPNTPSLRMVDLGSKGSKNAAWFVLAIGLALGLESLLEFVEEKSPFTKAASGVPAFVMMLLLGAALYGLARVVRRHKTKAGNYILPDDKGEPEQFTHARIDWSKLITGAMKLSAIAAVLLSVAGFGPLARFAILPTIETLAVIAILVIIYIRIVDFIRFLPPLDFTKSKNALTGAKFVLAALFATIATPLIAIFWGVRPAEIGDFIVLLRDGVTIGGTTVSFGTVFVFIGVFVLGYVLTRWTQRALQTVLLTRLDMDDGTKSAIVTGIGYIGIMIAFVAAVGAAGIDLSNLAIIFGALSVGIGFGMQSIVSNFVSGIIMLVERPIKEGDSIVVGEYAGIVDKISVRATRIQSFDHDDVIIPNSELIAGTVRNRTLTDRLTRVECSVGIAYDADVNKAFDILYEVANSHERMVPDPPPNVVMEQLGDSALMLRLFCFIDEVGKALTVRSEMYVEIVRRFADAGIAIPFPQRDLHMISAPEKD